MTIEETKKAIKDFLATLEGVRSDEIAANLEKAGITGVRSDCHDCPLHRLIRKEVPALSGCKVEVLPSGKGWVRVEIDDNVSGCVAMPASANDFANLFDRTMYPELVDYAAEELRDAKEAA